MSVAEFVEQPQALFADGVTPVRDRGFVICPHGQTWPADSWTTRPSFFNRDYFKMKVFENHQRRFPDCDCTLDPAS